MRVFSPESRKPVESCRCGSLSPRSTRSSATWRATASAFSPLSPTRARRARRSSSSPSSRSPAIRPRTCCCDPRSCARPRSRCARSRAETTGLTALVGTPWFDRDLFNACAVCADGEVEGALPQALPAELRRLRRGALLRAGPRAARCSGSARSSIGPTICEDIWQPGPPATDLALAGAELLVNLSASPYHVGKAEDREEMLVTRARDNSAYLAFCNLVGGQDELALRRPLGRARRRGRGARARAGLRGGAARRRPRSERGDRRRLRDVRRRALAREREDEREPVVVELASGVIDTKPSAARSCRSSRARADAAGARAGAARLRRQERLRRRRARALRRDRLGARRDARGRRARAGARALRLDAVALLVRGHADRRAAAGGEPRLRLPRDRRSRTMVGAFHDAGVGTTGSPPRTCRRASAA